MPATSTSPSVRLASSPVATPSALTRDFSVTATRIVTTAQTRMPATSKTIPTVRPSVTRTSANFLTASVPRTVPKFLEIFALTTTDVTESHRWSQSPSMTPLTTTTLTCTTRSSTGRGETPTAATLRPPSSSPTSTQTTLQFRTCTGWVTRSLLIPSLTTMTRASGQMHPPTTGQERCLAQG